MNVTQFSTITLLASTLFSGSILAADKGDFKVYLRAVSININNNNGPFELNGGAIPNTDIEISDSSGIGFAVAYMATDNISLELQLGESTTHSTKISGLDQMGVPSGTKIMESTVMSPSLTALYHFGHGQRLRPYVGMGVNYTAFSDEEFTDFAKTNLGAKDHTHDKSHGVTVQAGVDYEFSESWLVNANVLHSQIGNDGTFTTNAGTAGGQISVNPYIFSVGLGKTF